MHRLRLNTEMIDYAYENYIGDRDFVFIRCAKSDKGKCTTLVNRVAQSGVKVFFDVQGSKDSEKPAKVAQAIYCCETALFFISKKACASLDYRNSINYAMEINKNTVYVALEDDPLAHGLEMQLANVPRIDLSEDIEEALKEHEVITQDVLGGEPVRKHVDIRKKILMWGAIAILVIAFVIAAMAIVKNRVEYYNSAEYALRNVSGSEYVNIASYGQEGLNALSGMSIGELDLSGSDISDLAGIQDVAVEALNVSDCSGLHDLKPITGCKTLRRVKISQDMLKYARNLLNNGIEFEVTK